MAAAFLAGPDVATTSPMHSGLAPSSFRSLTTPFSANPRASAPEMHVSSSSASAPTSSSLPLGTAMAVAAASAALLAHRREAALLARRRCRANVSCTAEGASRAASGSQARSKSAMAATGKKGKAKLQEVESRVEAAVGDTPVDTVADEPSLELEMTQGDSAENVGPRYAEARLKSIPRALPFLPEPGYRNFVGNVPGDAGFDPAGFCTDVPTYIRLRQAELKHARIAMVGALAWPVVEIFEPDLSQELRFPDVLAESGGRFLYALADSLSAEPEAAASTVLAEAFLTVIVVTAALFEFFPQVDREPGDVGFDPLGLVEFAPPEGMVDLLPEGRSWMKEAELKHGRLAMAAVLFDALDEFLTQSSIVEDAEGFFHFLDVKFFRWQYWLFGNEDLLGSSFSANPDVL
eukprot:TRINITY_DN27730_c0_g1_i1.p1 TRINITY_DN27730_c0_g1~~TRINITY_DN27730_c0_g1_i1.p1  ORF type:complete len:406 (+),score=91.71 TRINITY_DN27730_c0_g1_i1:78-1295(+)